MPLAHYQSVGCDSCREILSAGLDGESAPAEQAAADAHVATCSDCRRWLDAAAAVTRLARAAPAGVPVDVTDRVLPAAPGPARARAGAVLRLLLALLGTAQVVLAAAQIATLSGDTHVHDVAVRGGAAPGHLWHESAAWNLALGVAFLWVAARRGRFAGMVALLSVFVGMLALLSAGDVMAGRVEPARLASHGFVVAGYLIVLALAVPRWGLGDPPARGTGEPRRWRHPGAGTGRSGLAPVIPLRRQARAAGPAGRSGQARDGGRRAA